jgi:hypothetical protein
MLHRSLGLLLLPAALALAGCTEVEEASEAGYEPVKLSEIKGAPEDLHKVTFTEEGARRTALKTAPVLRSGRRTVVPYAALIYGADGTVSVYTSQVPRSFVRAKVVVDRVDGERALLSAGPAPGTKVVTVGAAEVYGAELEIAGGH